MKYYLTETEIELRSLIVWHRNRLEGAKRTLGKLHPKDIEALKMLEAGERFLNGLQQSRKKRDDEKNKPRTTECRFCKVQDLRSPIDEEKSNLGFMHDIFKCESCGKEFFEQMPNNPADRKKFLIDLLAIIEKHHLGSSTNKELKEQYLLLKEQHEASQKTWAAEEKLMELIKKADEEQQNSIEEWRNFLLIAKLKGDWSNAPMAES